MSFANNLKARAQQWLVKIDETRETSGALLAFGVSRGSRVVLKILKQQGDEWLSGEILQAFDGDATVRVLEYDAGAVLLERLDPGQALVDLVRQGKDEEATEILAEVMRRMVGHVAPTHTPTLLDWSCAFERYLRTGDKQVPSDLVCEAGELYRSLGASQGALMLLHGDLQHYNVLYDASRGWIAIDPKGVVGELEYEVGAILRNPVDLPDLFTSTATIERRLEVLAKRLGLDYERALKWAFAQAVLSVVWDFEDGYRVSPAHSTLRLAHAITALLH